MNELYSSALTLLFNSFYVDLQAIAIMVYLALFTLASLYMTDVAIKEQQQKTMNNKAIRNLFNYIGKLNK